MGAKASNAAASAAVTTATNAINTVTAGRWYAAPPPALPRLLDTIDLDDPRSPSFGRTPLKYAFTMAASNHATIHTKDELSSASSDIDEEMSVGVSSSKPRRLLHDDDDISREVLAATVGLPPCKESSSIGVSGVSSASAAFTPKNVSALQRHGGASPRAGSAARRMSYSQIAAQDSAAHIMAPGSPSRCR